jgi:hypothetical protein
MSNCDSQPISHRSLRHSGTCLILLALALTTACLDSELAKRFREGHVPGFVSRAGTAIVQPDQAEAGLREDFAALIDDLGSLTPPRTASQDR